MRKTRRITYKKTHRKNKTIKCRKNTRRCKYRRKRALYGGGKETKPQPKIKKSYSDNDDILDTLFPITRGNIANPPLFHIGDGKIIQARPVPDGPGLVNTFANSRKITPAEEKRLLKKFE